MSLMRNRLMIASSPGTGAARSSFPISRDCATVAPAQSVKLSPQGP